MTNLDYYIALTKQLDDAERNLLRLYKQLKCEKGYLNEIELSFYKSSQENIFTLMAQIEALHHKMQMGTIDKFSIVNLNAIRK